MVVSDAQPAYSPDGRALVASSTLAVTTEREVREEVARAHGVPSSELEHLTSVTVTGVMLVIGTLGLDRLTTESVNAEMGRGGWWYVLYGALALLGIIAQLRARGPRTMRQQWGSTTPARAVAR